ncbi:MAG: aromatic-ring-hydroxylating dioxygenase subunit beta [Rhodospirillaceae bacterium]|nr:aromatic-ring-hydroxylating dioxygenase subunit beta [Rhodospirillaceae bacterium]
MHWTETVAQLQTDYAHAIDRQEFERWPGFFTDDCLYLITSRDNHESGLPIGVMRCESAAMLRDRVTAIRKASVFAPRRLRHLVGLPQVLEAGDDTVTARTGFAVYVTGPDGEAKLLVVGEYLDRISRGEGGFRFREKAVVYDNALLPDSIIFPL